MCLLLQSVPEFVWLERSFHSGGLIKERTVLTVRDAGAGDLYYSLSVIRQSTPCRTWGSFLPPAGEQMQISQADDPLLYFVEEAGWVASSLDVFPRKQVTDLGRHVCRFPEWWDASHHSSQAPPSSFLRGLSLAVTASHLMMEDRESSFHTSNPAFQWCWAIAGIHYPFSKSVMLKLQHLAELSHGLFPSTHVWVLPTHWIRSWN